MFISYVVLIHFLSHLYSHDERLNPLVVQGQGHNGEYGNNLVKIVETKFLSAYVYILPHVAHERVNINCFSRSRPWVNVGLH